MPSDPVRLGHVSVRNLVAARWLGRLAVLAVWLTGWAAVAARPLDAFTVLVTPVAVLAVTATLFDRRQGRSLAGVRRRGTPGSVTASGGALEVERAGRVLRLPRAEVVAGWTEPGAAGRGEEVVLLTRGQLEVRIALQAGTGDDLLRAAGVAADQRAVKMVVPSGYNGGARLGILVSVVCLLPIVALSAAAMVFALVDLVARSATTSTPELLLFLVAFAVVTVVGGPSLWLLLQRLSATALTVGTDGVVIEQLGSRRVVPRAALASAHANQGLLLLRRADGVLVRIRSTPAAASAVAARVKKTLQVCHEAPAGPVERLDRGNRPVAPWLDELRDLARDRGGYREASFDRQALLAVVKDGAAPAPRRVAAAAALSTRRDADDRAALRIAADTCADARLRVVLERAGEAELGADEVEGALARLSAVR